tara:strand:+ start:687 stop:2813 length:2127 start_codon:yes stop_codon:yes gene_type:complete
VATFTDPYDNDDYIASLVSGQVSGGALINQEGPLGWSGVSTDLGANFTSSAVTAVGYSPKKGANTATSLQFSADGSTWKSKDGTVQPPAGYYDFVAGSTDRINCGSGSTLDDMYTSGFSFSMWLKPDTTISSLMRPFNKGGFQIYINGASSMYYNGKHGKLRFQFYIPTSSTAYLITSPYCIKLGEWNHIAFHWDGNMGNEGTFIINGSLMDDGAPTGGAFQAGTGSYTSDAGSDLYIGNYDDSTNRPWPGQIGETIFWSSELTTEQLVNAYLYGSVPAGYIGRWSFYGDADDSSGNSNDGTVTGATNHIDPTGPPIGESIGGDNYIRMTHWYGESLTDNKYINLGTAYNHINAQSFSVSMWVSATHASSPGRKQILGNYDGSNASTCFFLEQDSAADFNLYMNGVRYAMTAAVNPARGEWVHFAVTRYIDPSNSAKHTVKLYVNGVEKYSIYWNALHTTASADMLIANGPNLSDDMVSSYIANVAFWDSVRTPEQIATEAEDAQVNITEDGLAHFLPIDGTGYAVPDLVSGDNGLTSGTYYMTPIRDSTRPIYNSGLVSADVTDVGATTAFYYKTSTYINTPFNGFSGGFNQFSVTYSAGGGGGGGGAANTNLIIAGDTLASSTAFSTVSGNSVIIDSRNKLDVRILAMNSAFDCTLRKDTSGGDVISYVPAGNTKLRASIPVSDGTDVYLDGDSNTTLTYCWTRTP